MAQEQGFVDALSSFESGTVATCDNDQRLDWILVKNLKGVSGYVYPDGFDASDHLPVVVELEFVSQGVEKPPRRITDSLLARRREEFVSEGHPFDDAQGRLSDSRQSRSRFIGRTAHPFFISLLVLVQTLRRSVAGHETDV